MSGCGILTNGKGTKREYGEYNLDELQDGDRIGMMRKSSGALHYYINGIDQGVAAAITPSVVWGVVDLYGMAVMVTILEHSDTMADRGRPSQSLGDRVNNSLRLMRDLEEDDGRALDVTTCINTNAHKELDSPLRIVNTNSTVYFSLMLFVGIRFRRTIHS